jgi:hypothetical protein
MPSKVVRGGQRFCERIVRLERADASPLIPTRLPSVEEEVRVTASEEERASSHSFFGAGCLGWLDWTERVGGGEHWSCWLTTLYRPSILPLLFLYCSSSSWLVFSMLRPRRFPPTLAPARRRNTASIRRIRRRTAPTIQRTSTEPERSCGFRTKRPGGGHWSVRWTAGPLSNTIGRGSWELCRFGAPDPPPARASPANPVPAARCSSPARWRCS